MNTEPYLEWAGIHNNSEWFIFCSFGYKLQSENKSLSYTRLIELFVDALRPHVSDIANFGLHSLRFGGASAAANYRVPDRLFERHGRWQSKNAKDGYVQDDLNERFTVLTSLGL